MNWAWIDHKVQVKNRIELRPSIQFWTAIQLWYIPKILGGLAVPWYQLNDKSITPRKPDCQWLYLLPSHTHRNLKRHHLKRFAEESRKCEVEKNFHHHHRNLVATKWSYEMRLSTIMTVRDFRPTQGGRKGAKNLLLSSFRVCQKEYFFERFGSQCTHGQSRSSDW